MSGLLAYYPSEGLTKAEKNLSLWQSHLARANDSLLAGQRFVFTRYPGRPGQSASQLIAERRNYLRPLEERVAQYTEVVRNGRQALAGERAGAYLDHIERETAQPTPNWLVQVVGGLLTALVTLLPSRVSHPPVVFA